jgi:hypothetical protein
MFSANVSSLDVTDYMFWHKLSLIIRPLHNMKKEVAYVIYVCKVPLCWAHLNVTQHAVSVYYFCILNYYCSCRKLFFTMSIHPYIKYILLFSGMVQYIL